jgi:hypothetical protein
MPKYNNSVFEFTSSFFSKMVTLAYILTTNQLVEQVPELGFTYQFDPPAPIGPQKKVCFITFWQNLKKRKFCSQTNKMSTPSHRPPHPPRCFSYTSSGAHHSDLCRWPHTVCQLPMPSLSIGTAGFVLLSQLSTHIIIQFWRNMAPQKNVIVISIGTVFFSSHPLVPPSDACWVDRQTHSLDCAPYRIHYIITVLYYAV